MAVTRADQVLVGLNRTRRLYNTRMRELFGFSEPMPQVRDKLVCLRNDRTRGLLNGGMWNVKASLPQRRGKLRMSVVSEDDPQRKPLRINVLPQFFNGEEEFPYALRRSSDEFDFGYALTVHKAQGSQWNDVVLFDESFAFREHRNRWLYTESAGRRTAHNRGLKGHSGVDASAAPRADAKILRGGRHGTQFGGLTARLNLLTSLQASRPSSFRPFLAPLCPADWIDCQPQLVGVGQEIRIRRYRIECMT